MDLKRIYIPKMNLKRNKIYTENTIKIEICAANPNLNPKPFISRQNKHLVHVIMEPKFSIGS
jgi:hypothetical protein